MRLGLALAVLLAGCAASRPALRPVPAERPAGPDRAELQRLYDAAVEAYAKGERDTAGRLFREMLRLDPDDKRAQKGLRRLNWER